MSNAFEKQTCLEVPPPHPRQPKLPGEPVLSTFCPRPWSLWPFPLGVEWGQDSAWSCLDHFPVPLGGLLSPPCGYMSPRPWAGWGRRCTRPQSAYPLAKFLASQQEPTLSSPQSGQGIPPSTSVHLKEAHPGPQSVALSAPCPRAPVRMTCLFTLYRWRT